MNRNEGFAVAGNAAPTPREPTLNERLNRLSDRMQSQCERIEDALARVNGTPATPNRPPADKIAQISPTLPLATVVEHLETLQSRLTELASGVERIA